MGIKMPTYYKNRKTGKIEAKYVNCDTSSSVFGNEKLYERFETQEDLPLDVQPESEPQIPDPIIKINRRLDVIEEKLGIEKVSLLGKVKKFLHL